MNIWLDNTRKPHPLVGKYVMSVWLADNGEAIRFDTSQGESIIAITAADCCSSTWIEDVQGVDQVVGSVVTAVEDVGGMQDDSDDGEMKYYGLKITSEKGYMLIDYRNESNGYYGGWLVWEHTSSNAYKWMQVF